MAGARGRRQTRRPVGPPRPSAAMTWAGHALFLAARYTLGPALPRSQPGRQRTGWRRRLRMNIGRASNLLHGGWTTG
jgi:hypothetical protein